MQSTENTVVISTPTEFNGNKKRNFYITSLLLGFLWMLFHFTVVFFFTFQLESVILVWIFLWLWNFFSLLIDIPIGILQKYFKAKTLYLIGSISQFIAMWIFTMFIFKVTDFSSVAETEVWVVDTILSFFLSFSNIILLVIASICYGLTKELNEVTTLSYVMNHVDPSQYGEVLARNNMIMGIWMFLWLLSSWIIMSFNPKLIIFSVIFFIGMVLFFTSKFFDNGDDTITIQDIKELKISFKKPTLDNVKQYVVETIKKEDLVKIVDKTKYIFLKPKNVKPKINFSEIAEETKTTFTVIYEIFKKRPMKVTIYWATITVLTLWFWDTFASTFLIWFLDTILEGWSYVLLWIIALPAFGLQEPFSNMWQKYGVFKVAMMWVFLSWSSLVLLWLNSEAGPVMVMLFALLNSAWYAAGMSLGQISFLDVYNKEYADMKNLKEIDSNASAGPMKILQNLANVFWLVLWGWILWLLEYKWFFIAFGLCIIAFVYWSFKNKNEIKL